MRTKIPNKTSDYADAVGKRPQEDVPQPSKPFKKRPVKQSEEIGAYIGIDVVPSRKETKKPKVKLEYMEEDGDIVQLDRVAPVDLKSYPLSNTFADLLGGLNPAIVEAAKVDDELPHSAPSPSKLDRSRMIEFSLPEGTKTDAEIEESCNDSYLTKSGQEWSKTSERGKSMSSCISATMANSSVMVLEAAFVALGSVMVATLIYTLAIDGLPFRKDLLTPWMTATLVDFYINIFVLAVWVIYKESSWLASIIWVILLVCLGSITTCAYITIQLFKLSAEESSDPMYHLLLRDQDKKDAYSGSAIQLISAKVIFGCLGCLMLGTLVYTIITHGSPFNKELLTPWLVATLIDFYINVAVLSVWVGYKEPSWLTRVIWIVLLICFGSIVTCGYVVRQFCLLSPYDPLYLVLLNNHHRKQI
ncbi:hypothetical protein SOVF_125080 isoform B [Spinacia oleracea]|nr:hypothetical protein SOVF_125080 isoform B [Spinacia oleracea]